MLMVRQVKVDVEHGLAVFRWILCDAMDSAQLAARLSVALLAAAQVLHAVALIAVPASPLEASVPQARSQTVQKEG